MLLGVSISTAILKIARILHAQIVHVKSKDGETVIVQKKNPTYFIIKILLIETDLQMKAKSTVIVARQK